MSTCLMLVSMVCPPRKPQRWTPNIGEALLPVCSMGLAADVVAS